MLGIQIPSSSEVCKCPVSLGVGGGGGGVYKVTGISHLGCSVEDMLAAVEECSHQELIKELLA